MNPIALGTTTRPTLTYTDAEITHFHSLVDKAFAEQEAPEKVVKLSRKKFKELDRSLVGVKDGDTTVVCVQLHGKEKVYLETGGYKSGYLLPSVDKQSQDRMRIPTGDFGYDDTTGKLRKLFAQFAPLKSEYLCFDGYHNTTDPDKIVQVAPTPDILLRQLLWDYKPTKAQKLALIIEIMKAVHVLHANKWAHKDLGELGNLMLVRDPSKPLGFAVKLLNFDHAWEDRGGFYHQDLWNLEMGFYRWFSGDDKEPGDICWAFSRNVPSRWETEAIIKRLETLDFGELTPIELRRGAKRGRDEDIEQPSKKPR